MDDEDTAVGLDVRGVLFFFPLSTLMDANDGCSYFSARFRSDSMLDPGLVRVDEQGRNIYGLDRDPYLFKHVAEYLETNERPRGIGRCEENKILWSDLREEAEYLGLDDLLKVLAITFSCSPDKDGMKGVLYWLGTKKGTAGYLNPYERGAVDVPGYGNPYERGAVGEEDVVYDKSKSAFVQYRPNEAGERLSQLARDSEVTYNRIMDQDGAEAESRFHDLFNMERRRGILDECDASHPEFGCYDERGVLTFRNGVTVSPTHYSIRNGNCYGMAGDWDLSASVDGKNWIVLHKSRGRCPLYGGTGWDDILNLSSEARKLRAYVRQYNGIEARKEAMCDYLEKNQRHTWKLDSPSCDFFTHFRFNSVPARADDERRHLCLHGIGLEIWGNVREEQTEQLSGYAKDAKARIEELEARNEDLEARNMELESQVKQLEEMIGNASGEADGQRKRVKSVR